MLQVTNALKAMRIIEQYVYVIYTKKLGRHKSEHGFVKIGMTKTPRRSLNNVRHIYGIEDGKLRPAFLVELKTKALALMLEQSLHRRFACQNVEGEWFRYTRDMSDFLKRNLRKYGNDLTPKIGEYYNPKRKVRR